MKTCFSVCKRWLSRWWQGWQHKRAGFSVVSRGVSGQAVTPLTPQGFVCLSGELWAAQSPLHIMTGETVKVVGSQGVRLVVYPAVRKAGSSFSGEEITGSRSTQKVPENQVHC